MWKYITKQQINEFLLSLGLIQNKDKPVEILKSIYTMSNYPEKNYQIFYLKKKKGKMRTIYNPTSSLKYIQRQILKNILNNKQISPYAKAYHQNIQLIENALPHLGKKMILKLDIENFFESIQFIDIYKSCFSLEYFPKSLGILLTYLCTYQDYLPQGAPTSSYISNLVMKNFDETIGAWCKNKTITYTRYSDDMTFSGEFTPIEVIQLVRKELAKLKLTLNNQKTHVFYQHHRQSVTGIVVNHKLQVPQPYRKKIRQELYFIKKYGLLSHLNHLGNSTKPIVYLNQLIGKVQYVLQVNPQDQEFNTYKIKLEQIKKEVKS